MFWIPLFEKNGNLRFLGKDAGHLYIKGICSSLEDTIEIDDLFYYDPLTTDKNRYSIVSGSPALTYSSNGLNVNTSVAQIGLVKNNFLTLPSDYEAEITVIYVTSNARTGICFDDLLIAGGDSNTGIYKLSTTTRQSNITNSTYRAGDVVKIRKQGSTFTYYLNDVQKWTGTISDDNHLQQFRTYQNRSTTFKDLKIREL